MAKNEINQETLNKEQQKAFELVKNTNSCLFITGKAGTGKTTFVMRIQEEIKKTFLVLAPTGIAALKVGGQTIHSVFRFPFDVITPESKLWEDQTTNPNRYQRTKSLLRLVDTIIVDEVSMVRCDIVDAMDRILRHVMSTNLPFGGKQVVFVGDLCQLPPVVKKEESKILSKYYGGVNPFFYKAHVIKRMNLPKIEFRKVYRQTDGEFINILNKMRSGEVSFRDLELINKNIGAPKASEDYFVTLATKNNVADSINEEKLDALEGEEFIYDGVISGNFKENDCPVPMSLTLKVGAQVIVCRNKCVEGCVNGTIAKVSELGDDYIKIALQDGSEQYVAPATWTNYEKVANEETKEIENREVGSFIQFPLKLAWAITIHKSQGMTFDRMHFDLSGGVFASGQTYVAISRMRSLEGLTLSHPICPSHIMVNPEVTEFYKTLNDYALIDDELEIGTAIKLHLDAKDFDGASRVCLNAAIEKVHDGDMRNAALMLKKMFDVMLDDDCLLGLTGEEELLTNETTTSNFINAVFCLYGNRFQDTVVFADKVLSHRRCPEAMFVKARALYALGKYDEANDAYFELEMASNNQSGKIIDQKQYLFVAKLNEKLGNSNVEICKKLIKLCPECVNAYAIMRREAIKEGKQIDANGDLFDAFNDASITEEDFIKALSESDSKEIAKLRTRVGRLWKSMAAA
jgi:hypothetical protein